MKKTLASASGDGPDPKKGQMTLLKAIEILIGKPENIKAATDVILKKYRKRYKGESSDDDIKELAANKVIQNCSYMAAFSGGATALAGVVPGLGTVISVLGGTAADTALCMKFQIEMVMAIAHIYEHDISEASGTTSSNTVSSENRRPSTKPPPDGGMAVTR